MTYISNIHTCVDVITKTRGNGMNTTKGTEKIKMISTGLLPVPASRCRCAARHPISAIAAVRSAKRLKYGPQIGQRSGRSPLVVEIEPGNADELWKVDAVVELLRKGSVRELGMENKNVDRFLGLGATALGWHGSYMAATRVSSPTMRLEI